MKKMRKMRRGWESWTKMVKGARKQLKRCESRHKGARGASWKSERRTPSASSTISSWRGFHPRRTGGLGCRACLARRRVSISRTWHTSNTFLSKRTALRTSTIRQCKQGRPHSSNSKCSIGPRTIGTHAASSLMTSMGAGKRTSSKSQKASPQTTCSTWKYRFISQRSFKSSYWRSSFSLWRRDSGHLVNVWQPRSISFRMRSMRLTLSPLEALTCLMWARLVAITLKLTMTQVIWMTLMFRKWATINERCPGRPSYSRMHASFQTWASANSTFVWPYWRPSGAIWNAPKMFYRKSYSASRSTWKATRSDRKGWLMWIDSTTYL